MKNLFPFRMHFLASAILFLLWGSISAQTLSVLPKNPTIDDTLLFTFNAAEGNQALIGYDEAVYFHAGLITAGSTGTHDWKMVVGVWGKHDERTIMQPIGGDLYEFKIHPRSFFNIPESTIVQQIAFVFRNENGTLVAKTKANEDFLMPVNGFVPAEHSPGEMLISEKQYKSHRMLSHNALLVDTDQGALTIRLFDENIVEAAFHPEGFVRFDSSNAVVMEPKN